MESSGSQHLARVSSIAVLSFRQALSESYLSVRILVAPMGTGRRDSRWVRMATTTGLLFLEDQGDLEPCSSERLPGSSLCCITSRQMEAADQNRWELWR